MKNQRRKRCDICGELKERKEINHKFNPYERDVYNREVLQWICDDCDERLGDDI